MRIKPDPIPDGLFGNDNLDELLLALCNHYAPSVIPFVQQHPEIERSDFIAVRIISGGVAGRYVLQAYTICLAGIYDFRWPVWKRTLNRVFT